MVGIADKVATEWGGGERRGSRDRSQEESAARGSNCDARSAYGQVAFSLVWLYRRG